MIVKPHGKSIVNFFLCTILFLLYYEQTVGQDSPYTKYYKDSTSVIRPANVRRDYIISEPLYNKQNRNRIAQIVDGQIDAAIVHFQNYLDEENPYDLEAMYGLAMAYTQKGVMEEAMYYVNLAIKYGLPFERFLAGPRELLKPLVQSDSFQVLSKEYERELLHGPMLGCVTSRSAKFWVRTANEVPVQVFVSSSEKMVSPLLSPVVQTKSHQDYTAVVSVNNLKPNTRYYYTLSMDGKMVPEQWSFQTFPEDREKTKFRIGFGGGAAYSLNHERMWQTIASHHLLAFFFLGDNEYIDNPTRPAVQQYCYYRRQSRPEFKELISSTSIYAIYDDHDFTINDGWGGPEIHYPEWKIPVWRVFQNNWNNPSYGGGEDQPGCWFELSIGDVDFFFLDGRYYRTDPEEENPTMLGPVQEEWLFNKLKTSRATFKVIVSPVQWSFGAKPGSLDSWEGYKQEREETFSFIEMNRIEGVFLISADRHRSDVWKIERENGYTLYEFESSRLTNIHTHKIMPGALFSYNAKCSFGLLSFDTTDKDPEVVYQIINIDNEVIHTFILKRSQLRF